MNSRLFRRFSAALPAVLLFACGGQSHRDQGLLFTDWYIVEPMVQGGMTTAYGNVMNELGHTLSLTAVTLACAEKVEMHETVESGGRITMVSLPAIDLPPGKRVTFRPAQKHLMIRGLNMRQATKCAATFTVDQSEVRFLIPLRKRAD